MNTAPIVLKIRHARTYFENNVGGAVELSAVIEEALAKGAASVPESAYVVPLPETCSEHNQDSGINQVITESFRVVVILRNDAEQSDKLGFIANEHLSAVRRQLFRAVLNWNIPAGQQDPDPESAVFYAGGGLIDASPAYVIYGYDFAFRTRISDADGVPQDEAADFLRIWTDFVAEGHSAGIIPYTGRLPLPAGWADFQDQIQRS